MWDCHESVVKVAAGDVWLRPRDCQNARYMGGCRKLNIITSMQDQDVAFAFQHDKMLPIHQVSLCWYAS